MPLVLQLGLSDLRGCGTLRPMSDADPKHAAPRHEVRLLVTTIVVSAAALLLLARLRFPPQTAPPTVAAPVLERLAARATYDELAGIIADVQARVGPSLVALTLVEDPRAGLASERPLALPRRTLALRIDAETAVAPVPAGMRADRFVTADAPVETIAVDEVRGLSVVRLPPSTPAPIAFDTPVSLGAPAYLAAAEPASDGAALRPVFVSRADPVRNARWGADVYATGASLAPGTFLFSLAGDFAGLLVPQQQGDAVLVPAETVFDHVARLRRDGSIRAAVIGFTVQPMTTAISVAVGMDRGVVVTSVDEGTARSGLCVGDVIRAVNGVATPDIGSFAAESARAIAGESIRLGVLRDGAVLELAVPTLAPETGAPELSSLGLTLRAVRGVGVEVVAVMPGSAGARAGLSTGDLITHLAGEPVSDPRAIERAWASTSRPLLLGARRGARPFVTAVGKGSGLKTGT